MTATAILKPIKFCQNCQDETERNARGNCKPCVRVHRAAWKKSNPEIVKTYNLAWEKANLERRRVTSAAWSAANPDKVKAAQAAYRAANPNKVMAATAAWHKANPKATNIHTQNRRVRKLKNGGTLSSGLAKKLFKLQKGKCPCCRQPLDTDFHMDHIIPLFLGGSNTDDNMQLLRSTCNQQKHAKHPVDFMQSRGFLL